MLDQITHTFIARCACCGTRTRLSFTSEQWANENPAALADEYSNALHCRTCVDEAEKAAKQEESWYDSEDDKYVHRSDLRLRSMFVGDRVVQKRPGHNVAQRLSAAID